MTSAISTLRDSLPGATVLDRYRVGAFEQSEPFGDCYAGEVIDTRMPVSLKLLSLGVPQDLSDALLQFEELRLVVHPHVERVMECGRAMVGSTEVLCVVCEHVPGEGLHARLRRAARLPVYEAWKHGMQIANGLSAGHRLGVVHGDLRAGNVVLVPAPEPEGSPSAKLRNFGIARAATLLNKASPTLQQLQGSALSLAPEQILGEAVTAATDVYAFGTVLYRMLTGATPFHADNTSKIIRAHLTGELTAAREAAPDAGIPEILDMVVARCLARQPSERYPDADALFVALRECQSAVLGSTTGVVSRGAHAGDGDADSTVKLGAAQAARALGALPQGATASSAPFAAPPSTGPALRALRAPSLPGLRVARVATEALPSRPAAEARLAPDARPARPSSQPPAKTPSRPRPKAEGRGGDARANEDPTRRLPSLGERPSAAPVATWGRASYVIAGLTLVCVALVAWNVSWRARQFETETDLRRALAVAQTTSALSVPPTHFGVRCATRQAVATIRGRSYPAPLEVDLTPGHEPEMVEVSAPGYVTRRVWITLDRNVTVQIDLDPEAPPAPPPAPPAAPPAEAEEPAAAPTQPDAGLRGVRGAHVVPHGVHGTTRVMLQGPGRVPLQRPPPH